MCCVQLYTGIVKQPKNAKLSQLQSVELANCVLESICRELGYSGESCICTIICKIYIITNMDCLFMATSLWYWLITPKIEVDECSFPCHVFLQPKEIVVRSKRRRRSALADEKKNSSWFQVPYCSILCVLFYRMKVKLCQKASPPPPQIGYIRRVSLDWSWVTHAYCESYLQEWMVTATQWFWRLLWVVIGILLIIYGYKGLQGLSDWMNARDAIRPRKMPGRF